MLGKFKTALSHSSKLTLIMTGDDKTLTIAMFADPKKDGIKVQPITIKGSYDEVETALEDAIKQVFEKNDALLTNAALVSDQLAKDAKAKTAPAKPAAAKKTDASGKELFKEEAADNSDEVDKDDEDDETTDSNEAPFTPGDEVAEKPKEKVPTVTAAIKKANKAAEDSYQKALLCKDPDMINFHMNASAKLLAEAKVPEDKIEEHKRRFLDIKVDSAQPVEVVTVETPAIEPVVVPEPAAPVEEVKPPVAEAPVEDDDPDLF